MLYLLDANVLIRADSDYYPIDRMPLFWEWLKSEGAAGHAKIPFEIYEEIASGNDDLSVWVQETEVCEVLRLDEEVDRNALNRVLDEAYGLDLTDTELQEAGRDPFLIAYALMGESRCIVTKEVSKPSKTRGRRKIPDACNMLDVPWLSDFRFYQERNFRIV